MILYNPNIEGWNKNSFQPVSLQTVKVDFHCRVFGDAL